METPDTDAARLVEREAGAVWRAGGREETTSSGRTGSASYLSCPRRLAIRARRLAGE
jgi:hypothetical protein